MRITKTEEARRVLNNPGKRKTGVDIEIANAKGILEFMPAPPPSVQSNEHALSVWYQTLPNLILSGIVHQNDLNGFSLYCCAMGTYHKAAEQLNEVGMIQQGFTKYGEITYTKHPLLEVMAKCEATALRWGKEFGLTPLTRGNVKATRVDKKSKLTEFVQ
jgi:P27 family predicted phage terminase small subunit